MINLPGITLKDSSPQDFAFLWEVRRASMKQYLEQTWGPWDEAKQRRQFQASLLEFPHRIIEWQGQRIGILALKKFPDWIMLIRIFLLPQAQKQGIGTRIIGEILKSACGQGLPVRLRVLKVNPARRLYERLGFVVTEETATHYSMEARPSGDHPAAPKI
jgi:GNAT superfamily N-acetyltransferase